MEVQATSKFVRISPTKVRDLARAVQGMSVPQALSTLQFNHRKGAFLLLKTLKSAVANAENNNKLSAETLVLKEATVGVGPTLKRYRPRARGMSSRILKRMSHIKVVLSEREGSSAT